jgi:hypothetical protein
MTVQVTITPNGRMSLPADMRPIAVCWANMVFRQRT